MLAVLRGVSGHKSCDPRMEWRIREHMEISGPNGLVQLLFWFEGPHPRGEGNHSSSRAAQASRFRKQAFILGFEAW